MHSRIFGIVEKDFYEENIDNYDWSLAIFEDEVPGFADYCGTDTELDKDFLWLVEYLVNERHVDSSLFTIDDMYSANFTRSSAALRTSSMLSLSSITVPRYFL